jgi:hypothetical protein
MAVVISVGGLWISFSYLDGMNQLTGRATDTTTGTTGLTVSGEVSCSSPDNSISFGTMARSTSNDSQDAGDYITIQNDGNVPANITVYGSVELWEDPTYQTASAYWQIACNNTESGTCNTTYGNVPGADGNIILTGLNGTDAVDLLTVKVNVTVGAAETTGAKSGTLTFTCTGAD